MADEHGNMIDEIIIATGNPGKAGEIARILAERGGAAGRLRVFTLKEAAGAAPDVEENGATLEENALIKARAARKLLDGRKNSVVVADDTGLFVDRLGGHPGVHSARYAGEGAPAEARNAKLLAELSGAPAGAARSARFKCVMAMCYPDGGERVAEGTCAGEIGTEPKGANGFGYDPLFYLPQFGCTMAELTGDEKNAVSHRGQAVRRMADEIEKYMMKTTETNA